MVDWLRQAGPGASSRTLDDVGGEAQLYRHAEQIANSDAFDVATSMVIGAWNQLDHERASRLLLLGLEHTPDPLAFAGAVEAIFAQPAVVAALADGMNNVLLDRAGERTDPRHAHIAVDALDGALRLLLAGAVRPFRLLELVSSVTIIEPSTFAEAVARRLGVLYLHKPETSVRDAARATLQLLSEHPDARDDALCELGGCSLIDGLESSTAEQAEAALRTARRDYSAAIDADQERLDARLYASALDGVLALIEQRPAADVEAAAEQVEDLALVRAAWHAPGRLGRWLGDTSAAEQHWWMVTAAFAQAAGALDEDVWLNAATSLEAIARAHRAARVARVLPEAAPGLRAVIEPRISNAFIADSSRVRALKQWATQVADDPELEQGAIELQEVVEDPKGDTATLIADLRARADDPTAVDAVLQALDDRQCEVLERRLETLDGEESVLLNRVAWRVNHDIRAGLEGVPDYTGTTRIFFDRILDLTIRFVEMRQDIQTGRPGGRFHYLSQPDALERDLQLDYYEFMKGTIFGAVVDIETPHIGGGRTDIVFRYGGTRIVGEIKRDTNPAATGHLDSYLNQAGLYQSANVALGLLLVLDLSPKPQGQVRSLGQSIWLAHKPDLADGDLPRLIVTALVPGNRPTPSGVT
ncbi:hypothetical protein [Actinoallomurus acaciae]|uniref:Uncharacterized protein n=1 Tax=Actinoallomurus acaciae TaxID=502577 RepID=A0ABV5Y8N5_9ACTN